MVTEKSGLSFFCGVTAALQLHERLARYILRCRLRSFYQAVSIVYKGKLMYSVFNRSSVKSKSFVFIAPFFVPFFFFRH